MHVCVRERAREIKRVFRGREKSLFITDRCMYYKITCITEIHFITDHSLMLSDMNNKVHSSVGPYLLDVL